MQIIYVPSWHLQLAPPKVWEYIDNALERGGSLLDVPTIARECEADNMQLWFLSRDGKTPFGAFVTEIRAWPKGRVCTVIAGGSEDGGADVIADGMEFIEQWARETQFCTHADVIGRKGWRKRLPQSFKQIAVHYREEL
jgi:hypothetical protein